MNERVKSVVTNWRFLLLVLFLIFALWAIQPHGEQEGVSIRSVVPNSSAALGGIANPAPKITPLAKERLLTINGNPINSVEDYYHFTETLRSNTTVRLSTTKGTYTLLTKAANDSIIDLGLRVAAAPTTNLRKGLDLEGGTRVLLEPAEDVTDDQVDIIVANLQERLNVYGLSDVVVRPASDLSGKDFILVEIAGVTEEEVKDLLARQGKFESTIGNKTVFSGGEKDITYVCRSAECAGIRECSQQGGSAFCTFFFGITLSPEAAERQAGLTRDLAVVTEGSNQYLSQDIILYLDDVEVDSLRIGAELRGRATTSIQISGSGTGQTEQEAFDNAKAQMKKLQTIIITGSLPVSLTVVKFDTISPTLGKEFLSNITSVVLLAFGAVALIISLRYRKVKIVVPLLLALASEIVLILGFAAMVGWNLDLAAIAGIIIVIGTGVDHFIMITDEILKGETGANWKQRLKNALFIVVGAYLTTSSGMIPLLWAGAGLLKGFALTTLAGLSFGVLIARPAYAAVMEKILKE
ncbi:TPA: hypothetical protein HA241_05595 [Candidatus Woesearchaeota archaeon]|nr:hypothetical protein [Candidatus Woesearchaeota archaeon]